MSESNGTLTIKSEYLEELVKYIGSSLVGKLLKRFEILEDKNAIKKEAKELIYEELRHFRDLVIAHNKGLDISTFNFIHRDKPQ